MNDIVKSEIAKLEEDFKKLFLQPPFYFSEVADFVESICTVYKANTSLDKAAMINMVAETFEYFDKKYFIIDKLDEAISLPGIVEPFDGPAIRFAIKSGVIPLAVNYLFKTR